MPSRAAWPGNGEAAIVVGEVEQLIVHILSVSEVGQTKLLHFSVEFAVSESDGCR